MIPDMKLYSNIVYFIRQKFGSRSGALRSAKWSLIWNYTAIFFILLDRNSDPDQELFDQRNDPWYETIQQYCLFYQTEIRIQIRSSSIKKMIPDMKLYSNIFYFIRQKFGSRAGALRSAKWALIWNYSYSNIVIYQTEILIQTRSSSIKKNDPWYETIQQYFLFYQTEIQIQIRSSLIKKMIPDMKLKQYFLFYQTEIRIQIRSSSIKKMIPDMKLYSNIFYFIRQKFRSRSGALRSKKWSLIWN
jgi:hypothetical protein